MNDKEEFISWVSEKYPDLLDAPRASLLHYGECLTDSADRLGLVSRRDLGRIFTRHLREVSAPEFVTAIPQKARVLDVGSGGGLPGIPLGILRPDLEITLLEPREKKAAFLERTVLELQADRITVLALSLETLAQRRQHRWDVAVARGLAWTEALVRSLRDVVKPGGRLVRFGAPDLLVPGVNVVPISPQGERAVQIWPSESWGLLPGAR